MRKGEPLVIFVVGRSGSGKTTTIEYLTGQLTRLSFRVGVVKHVHQAGFSFDTEGKNTWRHAQAGARIVIGVAPGELAIFKRPGFETPFEDLFDLFEREKLDLVLVEGFSKAPSTKHCYRIVTAKNTKQLRQALARTRPPILAITGRVAATKSRATSQDRPAPTLDMQTDGNRLVAIVRKLLRPNELRELYRKAAVKHGSECIGLAIGIRAAYLASNILGSLEAGPKLSYGTKKCVAEAFRTIFPEVRPVAIEQDDTIRIENSRSKVLIQLAPKRAFGSSAEALRCSTNAIFKSISFERNDL